MGLRVNNNIAAFNSYRNLQATDKALNSSLEKLSSGLRINKAADDAAGLVISEGLRSQVNGMTVAARNAQDGVNVAQTADGALGTVTSILQRMRDLAVQASNTGSSDASAQQAAQTEFDQLNKELTRISDTTAFGSTKLLNGTYGGWAGRTTTLTSSAAPTLADVNAIANTETFTVDVNGTGAKTVTLVNVAAGTYTADGAGAAALKADLRKDFDAAGISSDVVIEVANDLKVSLSIKATSATDSIVVADGTGTPGNDLKIVGTSTPATENAAQRKTFQVGANGTANDTITISIDDMDATALGTNGASLVGNAADGTAKAADALKKVDAALAKVSSARANLGALQNRFEHAINSLNVSIENITASESAIRDTDMAAEMTKFTRSQILSQAGTSMLAQANSASQNVLALLRG